MLEKGSQPTVQKEKKDSPHFSLVQDRVDLL